MLAARNSILALQFCLRWLVADAWATAQGARTDLSPIGEGKPY